MARRKKQEEHVNHERWLVSYADFITLLFAFFVVMFAVSQVDTGKLGRFVESTHQAFHIAGPFSSAGAGPLSGGGGTAVVPLVVSPAPTFLVHTAPTAEARDLEESVRAGLADLGVSARAKVRQDARGVVVSLAEADCFERTGADLAPGALDLLRRVAKAVEAANGPVQVEVHGDPAPRFSVLHPTAWELSAARAARVARLLQDEAGFRAEDLSATGLATVRPASAGGEPLGPRVDIVLVAGNGG